jgi:hypothetical protein
MPFLILLTFSALAVSAVAGYFSIAGLMAIFPAAAIPILAMGVVLEIAKLVTASWIYRNWSKAQVMLKVYFTSAVVILSLITSMGIYGFLSKAHLEHSVTTGDKTLQIGRVDSRIDSQQRRIDDANRVIEQLDQTVETLIDYDRIRGDDGAIAVRQSQESERESLNIVIDNATTAMDELLEQKLTLETEQLQVEVEVGPIKYIAELIYQESDKKTLDKAVRFVIILLVLVFDPLAILLVIAANMSLLERRGERISFTSLDDTAVVEDVMEQPEPESLDQPEVTENEREQFKRLDRSLRAKMEWIIDKKD